MLTWPQRTAVVSGNALEFYDIAVFAAISPYLAHILSNNGIANSAYIVWGIFALRFLIRPFGGIVVGKVADRKGRKKVLIMTSSITGIATLCMALMPTQLGEWVLIPFLLCQMAQAFSFGGEYPTIIQYLHRGSKENEKARISSLIVASSIVGVLVSLLLVLALKSSLTHTAMQQFGWRIPLIFGAINIAMSFWFRLRLPTEMLDKGTSVASSEYAKKTSLIFLISATGAVIFYVQNLSSSILSHSIAIPQFGLINSSVLLALILAVGWLTDKVSLSGRSFKLGVVLGVLALYPCYSVLSSSHSLATQTIALLVISIISALVLANLAAVLFDIARGDTMALGMGYNVALSIFGGLSPLVVKYLSGIDVSYIGAYAALAMLPALFGIVLASKVSSPSSLENASA